MPTADEYSFLGLIKKATEVYKIPVLVATKFLGGNAYKDINDEPAIEALEAGAISTRDMTDVMAQVKLMWVLSQGHHGGDSDALAVISEQMMYSNVGEVS